MGHNTIGEKKIKDLEEGEEKSGREKGENWSKKREKRGKEGEIGRKWGERGEFF